MWSGWSSGGEGCGQVDQVGVRGVARLVKCGLGEWSGWSSEGEGSGQFGEVGVRGVVRLVK